MKRHANRTHVPTKHGKVVKTKAFGYPFMGGMGMMGMGMGMGMMGLGYGMGMGMMMDPWLFW